VTTTTTPPQAARLSNGIVAGFADRLSPPGATRRQALPVLVVEHEPLTRAALCDLVERHPRLHLSATATTVAAAAELIRSIAPAVVIVDLFLPDGDACGLVKQVAGGPSRLGVVVVTDFATASAAAVCRAVGILTCLTKSARPECLVAAAIAAGEGKTWHGPGAVAAAAEPLLNYLQTQVLAEVASGESNEAIARRLGYSVNYVKDLIASLRSQLGARDRAHAASLGVALRLVRPLGEGRFSPALPGLEEQDALWERRRRMVPLG
jgi:DNA-binding NarL/FixJ family response regulator